MLDRGKILAVCVRNGRLLSLFAGVGLGFLMVAQSLRAQTLDLPAGVQDLLGNVVQLTPQQEGQPQGEAVPAQGVHLPPLKEKEPNDTPSEAQALPFARDLEGQLQDDDVDVYAFSLDGPAQVAIMLAFPEGSSGAAILFGVLKPDGKVLLPPRAVFPDFERVSMVYGLPAGTFYVQVGPMPYHAKGYVSPPYAVYIEVQD